LQSIWGLTAIQARSVDGTEEMPKIWWGSIVYGTWHGVSTVQYLGLLVYVLTVVFIVFGAWIIVNRSTEIFHQCTHM